MTHPAREPSGRGVSLVHRWNRFWFEPIPPHPYAVLRILFGVIGCLTLLVMADIPAFWSPDGLVESTDDPWKGSLTNLMGGTAAGGVLFGFTLLCYAAMGIGFRSRVAVPLCLLTNVVQSYWNPLPLSGAHYVTRGVLFALIWVDTGAVWSVDARGRGAAPSAPVWPLRLLQFQVAVIYFSSGLWKLGNAEWRSGTALAQVLANNVYRRFPIALPEALTPYTVAATHLVLAWELGFPFAVLNRWTRRLALALGILLHLGMWLALEIGPFTLVMLSTYVAFVSPERVASLNRRGRSRDAKSGALSA